MQTAYIVAGFRTAVGKAPRGKLRFARPDEVAAAVVKHLVDSVPSLDKSRIEDVIVGNATPEAEQGLNIARIISLMGLDIQTVPGMTVNRYCASGLESIAIASAKIQSGMADCIIAGGLEFMSPIPFGGWRILPNPDLAATHADYYWNMGLTAEEVARRYEVSREDQDEFAYHSHQKAGNAIAGGYFKDQIVPVNVRENYLDEAGRKRKREYVFDTDEGVRFDTTPEALAKLKPVFDAKGSVTAGSSSQTSDGAAFVLVMSEKMVKELKIDPIARMVSYQVSALEPAIMGMGPVFAIPGALKRSGMKLKEIDLIELNEAFASQSLAIRRELNIDPEILNVNGGAIALGHPLGCTGSKLTVQILNELKRRRKKYGMVTMCVGTGQGAAGIFEMMQ